MANDFFKSIIDEILHKITKGIFPSISLPPLPPEPPLPPLPPLPSMPATREVSEVRRYATPRTLRDLIKAKHRQEAERIVGQFRNASNLHRSREGSRRDPAP